MSTPVWPVALTVGILAGFVVLFTLLGAVGAQSPAYGRVPSPAPGPLVEAGAR